MNLKGNPGVDEVIELVLVVLGLFAFDVFDVLDDDSFFLFFKREGMRS